MKLETLARPSLYWLLVFVPVALAVRYLAPGREVWIFVAASVAIIPLAGVMGKATEHLATRAGAGIGGLLNASFGNAAELIIAGLALREGLYGVVKASLTGSIIGNILLVLGASFVAGGVRFKRQEFNPTAARMQSTMLTLAAIAVVLPAGFHHLGGAEVLAREGRLSLWIAGVLLATYGLGLLFTLHTHRNLFSGRTGGEEGDGGHGEAWSVTRGLVTLTVATGLVAWMSEILVHSIDGAAASLGMTDLFVGVMIVAVVGNAAEHSTAILVAFRDRMDLSISIAIGSSTQIALFVTPLLVLLSYAIAPQPMDLVFTPAEVLAVLVAVAICAQVASDGESHWLEGVQLLSVYLLLGLIFYFLPEAAAMGGGH